MQCTRYAESNPLSPSYCAGLTPHRAFQISCRSAIHYHEDRGRFFAWWHKLAMFGVVLGGAATITPLGQESWIVAEFIMIVGLIELVFDMGGKARLHESLRRRIYELLTEAQDENTDLVKLEERAVSVYADEPPCMHAVNALAHNSAMAAFERPKNLQIKISRAQQFWRNVYPYPQTVFKTFGELGETG